MPDENPIARQRYDFSDGGSTGWDRENGLGGIFPAERL
jgi:hypothetical protein